MRVQAYPNQLDQAVDQVTEVLRRRRNVAYNAKNNFSIQTAEMQVQEFHNIVAMVAVATVVLSSIGLLIGGVGVMNIMLVSVTERTREIGVRKAIGARSSDITWQFLLEAMTLTGAGGIIALILVNGLVLLIRLTLEWKGAVPLWAAAARHYRQHQHRPDLRCLARHESLEVRPSRSPPLRIELTRFLRVHAKRTQLHVARTQLEKFRIRPSGKASKLWMKIVEGPSRYFVESLLRLFTSERPRSSPR